MKALIPLTIAFFLLGMLFFYLKADWSEKVYVDLYFYWDKTKDLLLVSCILILIKAKILRLILALLALFCGFRLIWDIIAEISWETANHPIVIFILYLIVVLLICKIILLSRTNILRKT